MGHACGAARAPMGCGSVVHARRLVVADPVGLPCMPRVRDMLPTSLYMVRRSLCRLHPHLGHVPVRL